jgi:hypothetical protein
LLSVGATGHSLPQGFREPALRASVGVP